MHTDDTPSPVPPEAELAPADAAATPALPAEMVAVANAAMPALAEPEMLVLGLRYLQQHIPEFTQLSVDEIRSMNRAAHLDQDTIDRGIHLASAWDKAKKVIGTSGDEMRAWADEVRRWD